MYHFADDHEAIGTLVDAVDKTVTEVAYKYFSECCPICSYTFDHCQCRFAGSAHPDRSKRRQVVLDHLYLLSKKQLEHVIELQTWYQTSYGDEERTVILEQLKGGANNAEN